MSAAPDALRRTYAANARGLAAMREKAIRSGKKIGGYTAEQLTVMAADYERFATMSDGELRAHLMRPPFVGGAR